jgi:hypothetical protein
MQYLLEVYSRESEIPESFVNVDSSAARPGRVALESSQKGPFLAGSIAVKVGWCFRSCHAARALRIAAVDLHIRSYRKVLVFGHFQSAIPRQRASQSSGEFTSNGAQRVRVVERDARSFLSRSIRSVGLSYFRSIPLRSRTSRAQCCKHLTTSRPTVDRLKHLSAL